MQSTRHTFGQHVVPHPPGAVGSVARKEAGANLGAELIITTAAPAARPPQPGIEATSRDTERPAQPIRRPDPLVWRCLSGSTMAPFPHPAHRTGRADLPHPTLGQDVTLCYRVRRQLQFLNTFRS
jgi:hypothetical protein